MTIKQIKEYLKQNNKTILDLPRAELKHLHGELCTLGIDKGFMNTQSVLTKGKVFAVIGNACLFKEINESNINQFKLK